MNMLIEEKICCIVIPILLILFIIWFKYLVRTRTIDGVDFKYGEFVFMKAIKKHVNKKGLVNFDRKLLYCKKPVRWNNEGIITYKDKIRIDEFIDTNKILIFMNSHNNFKIKNISYRTVIEECYDWDTNKEYNAIYIIYTIEF